MDNTISKGEGKEKGRLLVGRKFLITCSQTKHFLTSHFQNNKYFQNTLYTILRIDTRIITKSTLHWRFQKNFKSHTQKQVFKSELSD